MRALSLNEADVERLAGMQVALAAVEEALRRLATGEAQNVPRARSRAPGIVLHSMSASAGYLNVVGWKNYTTTRGGARFLVGLHDAVTGELSALIEADRLGQLRTGAATGVAIKHMTAEGEHRLAIFGAGTQAESQLVAACLARNVREVAVYSRSAERREAFAARMSELLAATLSRPVTVRAVDRVEAALDGATIVITITTSREVLFADAALAPDALICAAGSNWADRREISAQTVRRAGMVACDQVAACRIEAGDLVLAEQDGAFDWRQAVELGDLVEGKAVAPTAGLRLFKSVGLAVEDVALGAEILRRARAEGVGRPIA